MQMIVLGIAIIVLINGSAIEGHTSQETCIDQFIECAINRGTTDSTRVRLLREVEDELFGVEMIVSLKDVVHKDAALLGDPFAFALQKFRKPLLGGTGDFDGAQ